MSGLVCVAALLLTGSADAQFDASFTAPCASQFFCPYEPWRESWAEQHERLLNGSLGVSGGNSLTASPPGRLIARGWRQAPLSQHHTHPGGVCAPLGRTHNHPAEGAKERITL